MTRLYLLKLEINRVTDYLSTGWKVLWKKINKKKFKKLPIRIPIGKPTKKHKSNTDYDRKKGKRVKYEER